MHLENEEHAREQKVIQISRLIQPKLTPIFASICSDFKRKSEEGFLEVMSQTNLGKQLEEQEQALLKKDFLAEHSNNKE